MQCSIFSSPLVGEVGELRQVTGSDFEVVKMGRIHQP
jgi:hypothetical protein